MSGPRQPVNKLALPSQRMGMPSRQAIASMSTKSQFDVCGAPMRIVGRVGAGSVRSRQRLSAQYARARARRITLSHYVPRLVTCPP